MRRSLLPAIFLASFSGLVSGAGAPPVRFSSPPRPRGTLPGAGTATKKRVWGEILAAWRRSRTVSHRKAVEAILRDLGAEMDRAVETPNPIFERQRHIYESNGVAVWPIPIYPTGEGGIHCLVLE